MTISELNDLYKKTGKEEYIVFASLMKGYLKYKSKTNYNDNLVMC